MTGPPLPPGHDQPERWAVLMAVLLVAMGTWGAALLGGVVAVLVHVTCS